MKNAIFLVGGPGSGKDILIKKVFEHFQFKEYNIDQIKPKKFYTENIVVVANACDLEKILKTKEVLENYYYKTSLIFVDVSDDVSKSRLTERNINEETRREKYLISRKNLEVFLDLDIFENYFYFDNSFDALSEKTINQLIWIDQEISSLLESKLEKFKKKIKRKNSETPYNPLPASKDGINPTFDTRSAGNGDLIRNYQFESLDPMPLEQGIGYGSNMGNTSKQEPMLTLRDISKDKADLNPKMFGRIKKILAKNKNA